MAATLPAGRTGAARLFPEGFEVLITAVHPSEREALQAVAREHGIQLLAAARATRPPHLVITKSVRSPKYRAVVRADPSVPVVTPSWLLACVKEGRRLGYEGYRVGPFTGLTICFSGISASRKAALARQVQAVGGTHSACLDKKCTHLVTASTESDKYRFARRERIVCVQPKWIEDCLAQGCCVDEGPYLVAEQAERDQTGQSRLAAEVMPLRQGMSGLLGEDATLLSMPAPSMAAPSAAGGGVSETRAAGSSEATHSGATARGEVAQQASQRPASRLQREGPAAQPAGAAAAAGPATGGTVGAGDAPPLIQLSPFDKPVPAAAAAGTAAAYNDLDWDDDTPMFLDSCKIHLAGCTPEEQLEMLRVVREGAAKRAASLMPGLTHIVVGSDLTPVEVAELTAYAAANRQAVFVTLDWLRRCGARRERLPADDRFLIHVSSLQGAKRKAPALEHVESDSRLRRSSSQTTSGGEDTVFTRAPSAASGPLAGCYFTLVALRVYGSEGEEERVKETILLSGGRVFTSQTCSIVADRTKAYAICPHSLLLAEAAHLKATYPDFKLVDERQRFTPYWLECSLIAQRPLPPQQRGTPLYQPLPFPLPLPGMESVLACISGYETSVRVVIQRTLSVLGGACTEGMTRRNTHLILPEAAGAKYAHCASYGVLPVTADWLLDSIAYGRLQGEASYMPPGPANGAVVGAGGHSNLPSDGGGSTRSGAVGLCVTSQLGPTQLPATAAAGSAPSSLFQAAIAERPLAAGAAVFARGSGSSQQQAQQPAMQQQAQQAQQPASQGQQRATLRQRMAAQGRATQASRQSNDENAPAGGEPTCSGAAPLAPAWGSGALQPPPAQQAPHAAQAVPSLLDELLGTCGAGSGAGSRSAADVAQPPLQRSQLDAALEGMGPAAGGQPAQQAQQVHSHPALGDPSTLFDQIFGGSSPQANSRQPAAGPMQQQQQAAVAEPPASALPEAALSAGPQAGLSLMRSPVSGSGSNPSGRRSASKPTSVGRRSGRAGSSRLRPNTAALAALDAAEAAYGQAGVAGAGGDGAMQEEPAVAAGAPTGGQPLPLPQLLEESEQQGPDIAQMVDHIGGLLARVAPDQPMLGSQHDMPPPPPRGRGTKRPSAAGDDAESTMSNGSNGGGGGRQTRARARRGATAAGDTPTEPASGRQLRRSGRGAKEMPEVEMSQQVGYDASPTVLPARPSRLSGAGGSSSSDAAAKQRLRRMAAQQRGASREKDILQEMLG